MTSVCFYFQVHQPFRIRRYASGDTDPFYFDNGANETILRKVAEKCYRPATTKLIELVKRYEGRFRVSFSITATALDQFDEWAPDVVDLFHELNETGACEFLAETAHHSLSFWMARDEFDEQVRLHQARMKALFGQTPTVFRNTELTYRNDLAAHLEQLGGFRGVACEGVDRLLGYRSPNYMYVPPARSNDLAGAPVRLLLKNYRLSDDVAFRFSDQAWSEWPLTADRFAEWINQINGDGYLCNLFMDYETLGEHQWAHSGIFEFLDALPQHVFDVNPGHNDFVTVSEALESSEPVGAYDAPDLISWADTERDLSAWMGNAMQRHASRELYELEDVVRAAHDKGDEHILEDWRRLTTSDHLYYMCTKYWADGDVHKYFSPWESPFDAYTNFMNVLDSLRVRAGA